MLYEVDMLHLVIFGKLWHVMISQLTCIWLFPCENDPHHDGKTVHVRLLSGGIMNTLQVLRGHVAQCASSSHTSRSPHTALPARFLLGEFTPRLAGGQTKICNLQEILHHDCECQQTESYMYHDPESVMYLDVKILVH